MGFGVLPAVGTTYGPCATACDHRDCQATRTMAAAICHWCSKPIGYDTRYYDNPLVHALCLELALEKDTPR